MQMQPIVWLIQKKTPTNKLQNKVVKESEMKEEGLLEDRMYYSPKCALQIGNVRINHGRKRKYVGNVLTGDEKCSTENPKVHWI